MLFFTLFKLADLFLNYTRLVTMKIGTIRFLWKIQYKFLIGFEFASQPSKTDYNGYCICFLEAMVAFCLFALQ